jgi:hypothetical protein
VKCPLYARAIDVFGLRFPIAPDEAQQLHPTVFPVSQVVVPDVRPTGSPGPLA